MSEEFVNLTSTATVSFCYDLEHAEDYEELVLSPRQLAFNAKMSIKSFYYLDQLFAYNPEITYDLGCGDNRLFKSYYNKNKIIGIDPIHPHADIQDVVDQNFIRDSQGKYQSVFSINALHFRSLDQFADIVNGFNSMIANGGCGYLALNVARFIGETPSDILKTILGINMFDHNNLQHINLLVKYIQNEIKLLTHINFEIKDITINEIYDDRLDGNINLFITKI